MSHHVTSRHIMSHHVCHKSCRGHIFFLPNLLVKKFLGKFRVPSIHRQIALRLAKLQGSYLYDCMLASVISPCFVLQNIPIYCCAILDFPVRIWHTCHMSIFSWFKRVLDLSWSQIQMAIESIEGQSNTSGSTDVNSIHLLSVVRKLTGSSPA